MREFDELYLFCSYGVDVIMIEKTGPG